MSLKARVVLLVVAMFVAGIWALALSVTMAMQRELTRLFSADLSAEILGVAGDLDRDVQMHIDVLVRLAASLAPKMLAEPAQLDRALDQFADASVIVPHACFVANSKGIITAGYPEHAVRMGTSVEERDYFREVIAGGKPVIGAPVLAGTAKQEPAVPIAVPLRNRSGDTVGALVGLVLLSDPIMLGQLPHTKIGERGYFLVASPRDRLILSAPDPERILKRLPPKGVLPLLDRRLEDGFEGAGIAVTALGVEVLGVARKMATTGWMIIASVPTKELFAPIEDLKRQVYLVALLISLAVVVILRFFLVRQFAPLAAAGRAMRRMTEGEMPMAAIPVTRQDEIGELIANFNRLVAERRKAEQVREQLMRQLESLSGRLAAAQEEERRSIAYELHEELGQELMTLKLYLQMLGSGSGGTQAETPREEALSMVVHATERVRRLVLNLEPRELEDFGLHAAVRTYCERQGALGGWNLHLDAPTPGVRAPRAVERACFRVLQEGVSNVLHHAQATEVWVHLHQDEDELELWIRDNGIGFDRNACSEDDGHEGRSLGLFGMPIRAKHVGGAVQITSTPGAGTEVRAVFPLPAAGIEPD